MQKKKMAERKMARMVVPVAGLDFYGLGRTHADRLGPRTAKTRSSTHVVFHVLHTSLYIPLNEGDPLIRTWQAFFDILTKYKRDKVQ